MKPWCYTSIVICVLFVPLLGQSELGQLQISEIKELAAVVRNQEQAILTITSEVPNLKIESTLNIYEKISLGRGETRLYLTPGRQILTFFAPGYQPEKTEVIYLKSRRAYHIRVSLVKPAPGTLLIKTMPEGAHLTINGAEQWISPYRDVYRIPGEYHIQIRKEGYYAIDKNVLVKSGRVTAIEVKLNPLDSFDLDYQELDRFMEKLKPANIVFNPPDTLQVGETRQIVLLMSVGLSGSILEEKLSRILLDSTKTQKIIGDSLKVSTRMEAHLTGQDFAVTPVTAIQQLVSQKSTTRWEWLVEPREPGIKVLFLTLNAIIESPAKKSTQTIQTFRKSIYVHIRGTTTLIKWIDNNISWIAGGFFSVFTLILGYYLAILRDKRHREFHKSETNKKKIILP